MGGVPGSGPLTARNHWHYECHYLAPGSRRGNSMEKRRPVLLGLLAVVLVVGGGLWLARGEIALAVFKRAMARNMAGDPVAALPDGLHVGLCGAGSPMPDPRRAGPCTVVIAG